MSDETPAPSQPTPPRQPSKGGHGRNSGSDLPDTLPSYMAPDEPAPITGVLSTIDALLRQPYRLMHELSGPSAGRTIAYMLFGAVFCNLIYGLVAGTFSGGTQLWAAPVKIAGGLVFASFICLPSLYIFACLSGVRARIVEVAGLVCGLMAIMSMLLIGFAPVAWVFSQSTESLPAMGALHILFGLVACFFGMRFISAGFTHFKAASSMGLFFWKFVFLLVALQMTTALRPIVGTADTFFPKEKKFFLVYWGDNFSSAPKSESAAADTRVYRAD